MRLKDNTLTDYRLRPRQITKSSFFRTVQISITLAIICSFLAVGSVVFYRQYIDVKHQLEAQGIVLAANLAHNAEPFIVDYDKDQLNMFLDAMLGNSLVLFSGIINTRFSDPAIDVLKKQPQLDLKFVTEVIRQPRYEGLDEILTLDVVLPSLEIKNVIACVSPIFSEFKFPDDETTLLYGMPKHKGIVGYSIIAYRMPWEQLFSVNLKWAVAGFAVISLGLGWVLGWILSNKFTKRIREIHRAIAAYSLGDELRINDPSNDEISDISRAVEDLTQLTAFQFNTMVQSKQALQTMVEEKTRDLQQMNKQLREFNHNQRAFIGQTAQELKTLMTLLPLIQHHERAHRQLLAHGSVFLDRLLQMIQKNRAFSLVGALESVVLSEMLNDLSPLFDVLANKHQNEWRLTCDPLAIMRTDKIQLTQAFIQIMQNASKYTKNGRIEWDIRCDDAHVFIKCTDTGIGMDQDRLNNVLTQLDQDNIRLFDAFTTLGLGLVLIHRFCRNMTAKLICMSTKGKGTTIEIIHPREGAACSEMLPVVICVSKDTEVVRNMKLTVQTMGWDAHALPDASPGVLTQAMVVMIDFSDVNDGINAFKAIWSKVKGATILCVLGSHAIAVNYLSAQLPPTIDAIARDLCRDHGVMLHYGDINGVSDAFTQQYSYTIPIALRLVSCHRYQLKMSQDPVILIYQTDNQLKELIQHKGCLLTSLSTLPVFKHHC
jgi:signal transduction histidine kinase